MFIPIDGYAPDGDQTKPGILVDCSAMIPTLKGMAVAPSPVSTGLTLAAACRGAAILRELDNTTRLIAGSATKLYEAGSGSWTDRTRASGGDYGLTGETRWRFAQFGSVSLAAAKTEIIQASTSGAFLNVSVSPSIKAALIETVGQFVMAANTNETAFSDSPSRWYCSALGDYSDWTPSVNTQCASGTLDAAPGPILGLKRFGDTVIAYKLRAMFRGTYVGQPTIWEWPQIPGDVGAVSHESIVDIGTPEAPIHAFMGESDFYIYDGSRPRSIGTNTVKETIFGELNRSRQGVSIAQHDRSKSIIRWYYPTVDSINPDKCVVWNYRTNKWGRDDRQVEATVDYVTPGLAYDNLGSSYSTYHSLPDSPYDSAFVSADTAKPAFFDTSHILKTLDGTAISGSITTGDVGDDTAFTCVNRVRPRFITIPSSASLTNYYRNLLGSSLMAGSGSTLNNGKFDFQREARWHRFLIQFNGSTEIAGFTVYGDPAGDE